MGWKALLKTEWNESLLNSYWWLFIISNNLTFFCVLLPAVWPSLWCCGLSSHVLVFVCVCVCRRVFALLCTCFMVNKQLFSAKVSQLPIRSPAVTPRWQFGRWIPVDRPTLSIWASSHIQTRFKTQDVYCLWQHSLLQRMGRHQPKCLR